jgi:hypothetical protein
MSQNGGYAASESEQLGVRYLGSEDEDGDGALGDVYHGGRDGVLPAEDSIKVGGAEVTAAVLAKVDSREETAE